MPMNKINDIKKNYQKTMLLQLFCVLEVRWCQNIFNHSSSYCSYQPTWCSLSALSLMYSPINDALKKYLNALSYTSLYITCPPKLIKKNSTNLYPKYSSDVNVFK